MLNCSGNIARPQKVNVNMNRLLLQAIAQLSLNFAQLRATLAQPRATLAQPRATLALFRATFAQLAQDAQNISDLSHLICIIQI